METGRPKKYKHPAEMQKVIDRYFKKCAGEVLRTKDNKPILDKYNNPIILGAEPPTVTGLALALGFTSRQALLNYQDRQEFFDTVTRAKMRVQEYAEKQLYNRDGSRGAQFSLQNNFGWKNEQSIDSTINAKVETEAASLTDAELKARIMDLAKKIE